MSEPLRVALFREGSKWLAQILEHDVSVQGDHLPDLMLRLKIAIELEGEGLAALPPAPPYFQHLWPNRAGAFLPETPIAGLDMAIVA
jgi:hypothetical protein